MENDKTEMVKRIEKVFADIGGFTWEQAETWAGFCDAVGIDFIPFLKVMMNNICDVYITSSKKDLPDSAACAQLWVVTRANRTRFYLIESC